MRALLIAVLVLPFVAVAQTAPPEPAKKPAKDAVYKWVDDKGVVHYTDQPPTENAKPAELPPLQTYPGGSNPDLYRFDTPRGGAGGKPVAAARNGMIDIVTPAQDETFRGGDRTVPVAVVVTPPLTPDQRLIYFLDGAPQSLPTTDTSFAFTGVDRGSHAVSVALVDETGQELGRSGTVTVHVKPPTVPRK